MSAVDSRLWRITGRPNSCAKANWRRKTSLLHGAGREIVMVIQADFADGSHLGLPGKFADLRSTSGV